VEPWLKGNDGVDVARAASGSRKSRAKMVVVETHLKERRPWESLSPICHLSRQLGSIWPSTSFESIALMRRGAS
jgi:hypothetical protein